VTRLCARPGCGQRAAATLSYDYRRRAAWIDGLTPDPYPTEHDLCPLHAAGMVVPNGWHLEDRRTAPSLAPVADPDTDTLFDEADAIAS
jgi:hypothetical protein